MNRHLTLIRGEEAEVADPPEFCGERVYAARNRLQPCMNRARATVNMFGNRIRRVCGIHGRMHERRLEDVTWDP